MFSQTEIELKKCIQTYLAVTQTEVLQSRIIDISISRSCMLTNA